MTMRVGSLRQRLYNASASHSPAKVGICKSGLCVIKDLLRSLPKAPRFGNFSGLSPLRDPIEQEAPRFGMKAASTSPRG